MACFRMSPEQRAEGVKKLKSAYTLLAFMPGVPCIYYGDEAGLEGYADPYTRGTYPWGKEDEELREIYRSAIKGVGIVELRDMRDSGEEAEVICRFCTSDTPSRG